MARSQFNSFLLELAMDRVFFGESEAARKALIDRFGSCLFVVLDLMSIEAKRDQIVEELMPFDDHYERFAYIIDRAKSHPPLDEAYKIDTFLIEGSCRSCGFFLSSRTADAISTRTLMLLLRRVPRRYYANYTVEKRRKTLFA